MTYGCEKQNVFHQLDQLLQYDGAVIQWLNVLQTDVGRHLAISLLNNGESGNRRGGAGDDSLWMLRLAILLWHQNTGVPPNTNFSDDPTF